MAATNLRYIFLLPILLGLCLKDPYSTPDILIEESGKIFAIRGSKDSLVVSSKQGVRYARSIWEQAYGTTRLRTLQEAKPPECNKDRCIYNKNRYKALIIKDKAAFNIKDCQNIDLFINLTHDNLRCHKAVQHINLKSLEQYGHHFIQLSDEQINVTTAKSMETSRPWDKPPKRSRVPA